MYYARSFSPGIMFARVFFIFLFALIILPLRSSTLLSTGSGIWQNSSSWSPSKVPACGDSMVIQTNHTITINNQQDYTGCGTPLIIVIYGTLNFGNGDKLKLPCGSRIYVFPSGSITGAGGGGNSNTIDVCGTTFWDAANGNLTGPACVPPTLPTCSGVLPVLLTGLEAKICSEGVCIYWQTIVERNNAFFRIDRMSGDVDWREIGNVPSKTDDGTSRKPIDYIYKDIAPARGINYYRLRQFDIDGEEHNHGIVMAEFNARAYEVNVYPNPGKGDFSLLVPGFQFPQKATLEVTDPRGARVFFESLVLRGELMDLNLRHFAGGIYYLRIEIDNIVRRTKLLID